MSPEDRIGAVLQMLRFAILCTKHPGFREEREWRVIYAPTYEVSPIIEKSFAFVSDIPQEIHLIPLVDAPAGGLYKADLPNLLYKLIIGPSQQPATLFQTFFHLLRDAGIDNPGERIVISSIPLRN